MAAACLLARGAAHAKWRVETTIVPPPILKPRPPAKRPGQEPAQETAPAPEPEPPPANTEESQEGERGRVGRRARPTPPQSRLPPTARPRCRPNRQPRRTVWSWSASRRGPTTALPTSAGSTPHEAIAAFTLAPAGFNPYLYQIEVEPLADRGVRELFYLEPYYAQACASAASWSFRRLRSAPLRRTTSSVTAHGLATPPWRWPAYYLNQNAIVFARYQYIDFTSTPADSGFTDDIVHVGIRLRQ